jgi:hypothetical protein
MKPSIICGILFGGINMLTNIYLVLPTKNKTLGLMLGSGILFFNVLFSVLFTKKANGYILKWADGMKAAIQGGILQGVLYFISLVIIQNYVSPGFFPELSSVKQYFLILNINIIVFSIFSTIFGSIMSSLLHTKN